jgi:hypothetical protein
MSRKARALVPVRSSDLDVRPPARKSGHWLHCHGVKRVTPPSLFFFLITRIELYSYDELVTKTR